MAQHTYNVDVWFATSCGYRTVATFSALDAAVRRAWEYDSDARGVKVTDQTTGAVTVVKAEAGSR